MAAPPSEISGKTHPYQSEQVPGAPKGAFEARKVRAGFYIRVDMPGVPNDDVKIVKYNETNTVTFSAKAPPRFGYDSPQTRTYAGYVVVDRDISDVDFVSQLKNGCLRFFFPGCDASLHFLSPPQNPNSTIVAQVDPTVIEGRDDEEIITVEERFKAFISHDPLDPSGMRLSGGCSDHINPFLLSGLKGVYEHKIVSLGNGDHKIYVRVDVPDTCPEFTSIFQHSRDTIIFRAQALKKDYYSRFDKAAREYHGFLSPACQCCNFRVVRYENSNGVLRFMVHKSGNINTNPKPNNMIHCHIAPTPGGRLQPTTVELRGHLSSSSGSRPSRRRSSGNHSSQVPSFFSNLL